MTRPRKITFGEMRSSGVRGLLIYCTDFHCNHSIAISADPWPDQERLSDLEPRFVCKACGKKGSDVRSDFHWIKPPVAAMGYRCTFWRSPQTYKDYASPHARTQTFSRRRQAAGGTFF
jgi:hypothetical protein